MEEGRIKNFPIYFFAVIMGLTGLAIAYKSAFFLGEFLYKIGSFISILSIILFGLFLTIYLVKIFKHGDEVKKEFNHPVKASFFPTISISLLLLAVAFGDISSSFSFLMWICGTFLHFLFLVRTLTFWINKEFKVEMINPSWFIPIVGAIIVPIQGINYSVELSLFFFSIGLVFWIALFTIVLYRIIFHNPLPERLLPTLFILIAPPAVGFISYLKITGSVDTIANLLFYFALFLCIVLFALVKKFIKLRFYISWWAYTFPLDAVTIAILMRYHITSSSLYEKLSILALAITTLVIGIVGVKTLIAVTKREICVED